MKNKKRPKKNQEKNTPLTRQTVLILDFGSQYTQLIARRVRENKVFSMIIPYNTPAKEIAALNPKGIVLSGGPASVVEKKGPYPDKGIFKLKNANSCRDFLDHCKKLRYWKRSKI